MNSGSNSTSTEQSGTPSGTQTPDQSPIYPSIIFAVTETTNREAVNKAFNGEGLGVIFVNNGDELGEAVIKPEVFLIIVDVEFSNKRGIAFQSQFKAASPAFWIAIAKKLTTQQRSGLYAAGFADVLTHPVHPVLFKGRARMLLTRFLKTHDLPDFVVMPSGISRPNKPGSPTRIAGGGDNKESEKKGPYFGAGGSAQSDGPAWNNKIGSGDSSENSGPNVQVVKGDGHRESSESVHIRSGDDTQPQWNHHSSGKTEDPAWNHHTSESKDNSADWNNKISKDPTTPTGSSRTLKGPEIQSEKHQTKIIESDQEKSTWNNRISPNTESGSGSTKQFLNTSEPQARLGSTNQNNPISKEATNSIQSARAETSKTSSQFTQSEPKPTNQIRTENNSLTNSEGLLQGTLASPPRVTEEMKISIEASLGIPQTQKLPTKESASLQAVKEKIQALKQNLEWDRKMFPTSALPGGSHAEICSRGLRKCMIELKDLFFSVSKTLNAQRITLVSLKPTALPSDGIVPEDLHALCSSDDEVKNNEKIPSVYFPQIIAAFEQRSAVLLNEPVPDPLEGTRRPENWKISGKIESSSAVFPIFLADKPYAVLLLQFSDPRSDSDIPVLEQAVAFLGIPEIHYSQVDFLSRIHRKSSPPTKVA